MIKWFKDASTNQTFSKESSPVKSTSDVPNTIPPHTRVSITDQSDNSVLTAFRLLQYSNAYSQYLSLLEDQNINLKQYHEIYIYIYFSLKSKIIVKIQKYADYQFILRYALFLQLTK